MRFASNPRVYIYSIAALFTVVLLLWQERIQKKQQGMHTIQPLPQASVVKAAEMREDNTLSLPKLYVFAEELPYASELRSALLGKCTVLHIAGSNKEIQEFFQLKETPSAVLYGSENKEIARFNPPLDLEALKRMTLEALNATAK